MPRYFFNIRRHASLTKDPEGEEFPDLNGVIEMAYDAARELIARDIGRGVGPNDHCFEVTNEAGAIVFRYRLADAL